MKANGLINDNADPKTLTPIIVLVQDIYLMPILGTDLFDEIGDGIVSGNLNTDLTGLLNNYIMPVMLWYTLCEATPAMKYRYMAKGVMVKNSEFSQPADLQEIQFLMSRWKNNAEVYAERLTKYLKYNAETFPNYEENTECYKTKPNKTNFTSSIYVDPDECA